MPPIWWSASDGYFYGKWLSEAGYYAIDGYHMVDELPADAEVLVTVDWLENFRTAKSDRHRELATELAEANANLKARIRRLEAELPEVECPSCGAVIRARMAE
jgi:hypothetical protein